MPDGCFLLDWTSIFLIKYEDPIFVFVNICRSQSVCKEENKVSNRTLRMLKISLMFCALLTQPKWPGILKCWESLTPFPVPSIGDSTAILQKGFYVEEQTPDTHD